jgi:hypothetical protein
VYQVVPHTEWAKQHAGECAEKMDPWEVKDDPLAIRLHTVSAGRVKYRGAFQMAALRKTGLSEDEIVDCFRMFVAEEFNNGGGQWSSAPYRFLQWLRAKVKTRGKSTPAA